MVDVEDREHEMDEEDKEYIAILSSFLKDVCLLGWLSLNTIQKLWTFQIKICYFFKETAQERIIPEAHSLKFMTAKDDIDKIEGVLVDQMSDTSNNTNNTTNSNSPVVGRIKNIESVQSVFPPTTNSPINDDATTTTMTFLADGKTIYNVSDFYLNLWTSDSAHHISYSDIYTGTPQVTGRVDVVIKVGDTS